MTKSILAFAGVLIAMASFVGAQDAKPVNVLIITGDHVAHDWKKTTPVLQEFLTKAGHKVTVTETPAKDLTSENLGKFDVLLLNYRDGKGGPETKWSDDNKKAFAEAVKGGKGLVVYHFASSAFTDEKDPWSKEFETIIAGGWRKQGFHGAKHVYDVSMKAKDHPITKGMPEKFTHNIDELYQNSLITPGSEVLVTAYSDKAKDPKNTGKDEPMVWINKFGEGRVVNNALGHDMEAISDKNFQALMIHCVEWAATVETKSAAK